MGSPYLWKLQCNSLHYSFPSSLPISNRPKASRPCAKLPERPSARGTLEAIRQGNKHESKGRISFRCVRSVRSSSCWCLRRREWIPTIINTDFYAYPRYQYTEFFPLFLQGGTAKMQAGPLSNTCFRPSDLLNRYCPTPVYCT